MSRRHGYHKGTSMIGDARIDPGQMEAILRLARAEDLGGAGDLTSLLLPETAYQAAGRWDLVARQQGRFCGQAVLPAMLSTLAPEIRLDWVDPRSDVQDVGVGDPVARFSGLVCQMLAAERTLLNFLQHLSGVATLTQRFVSAVAGTHAKIYDTRKTTPGMRTLEKHAVRCGGGHSHRTGLYDAILIKDNHLADIRADRLAHTVSEMLGRIEALPRRPAFVEVECDTAEQLAELVKVVGIDLILLDNFELEDLRAAVKLRNDAGLRGKVELEASGGVTLDSVRAVAQTGVERIAVGAITHSAPILDLALEAV
jgi:nicotinate-nucleotide pyrophosphorylase (carboxylating)